MARPNRIKRKEHRKRTLERRSRRIQFAPCVECGGVGRPVNGEVIFPHRPDLAKLIYYLCKCGAYVGSHYKGLHPLGYPAGPETRLARQSAHEHFDRIWRYNLMSRDAAYDWLARRMGMHVLDCHIAKLNKAQAVQVTRIAWEYWNEHATEAQKADAEESRRQRRRQSKAAKQRYQAEQGQSVNGAGEAAHEPSGADGMSRLPQPGDDTSRDGVR